MGEDGRRQVFVFTYPRYRDGRPRSPLVLAYLMWPGGSKERLCTHLVDVLDGEQAKREAIREHRERCLRPEAARG